MKPKPKKLLTVKKEKKSTAPTPASLKRMKENALAQTRAQEAKLQWRRAAAAAATQKKRTWEGLNNSRKCAGLDWYDRDSWILQKLEPLVAVRHKGATVVVKGHRRLKAAVILKQQLRAKLYVRCRVFSLDDEAEETPATVLALYALNPQANLDVLIKGI
eukprot:g2830.t1